VDEPDNAPNKLVASVGNEINYGIRTLYTKEIAATFDEKKIKQENNNGLCCGNAEYF
jgi:hypothetical protein